ncbi:MAG TPA: MFS transporter [Candidatus Limnocylindrales bacterium]
MTRHDPIGPTQRRAFFVSGATLFAAGLFQSTLGPALPDLARNTSAHLAALGAIFTALFVGSLVSQLAAGAIGDRLGHRPVLIAGLLLAALGMLGVANGPTLALVLAPALVAGLGNGALILGANLVIADAFTDGRAAALNLVNVFFGVGAIAGPAIVGGMLNAWGTAVPMLWIASGVLVVPALAALGLRLPPAPRQGASGESGGRRVLESPLLWVFGLLVLVYLGNEVGMGGWLATYLGRSTGTPLDVAAVATSGYWLALTAGRVLGALIGARLDAARLLLVSLCGALVGGSILVLGTGSAPVTVVAALVLGLSFGPVYPTTIALVTATFHANPGVAAGVVMALGSVGGAALPWLLGVVILDVRPVAGAALIAGSAVAMLILWSLARLVAARGLGAGRGPTGLSTRSLGDPVQGG